MQRLLYHAPDNPNQESPFDRAIVQVVQGQDVSIVSPYIGVQYLQRLIGMSSSWRLISDVLEWLSAIPVSERGAVYEFLKEHDGQVHHYPAIHAKTVMSRVGAYTGSANLTDAGVLRRTEFGVLLTDPDQVREIQQWFDAIWRQTSPPPLQSVLNLIEELAQISHIAAGFADLRASQLESSARRVRAKLVKILGHEPLPISARQHKPVNSGSAATVPPPLALEHTVAPEPPPPRMIEQVSKTIPTLGPTLSHNPQQDSLFDLDDEIEKYVALNAVGTFTFAELHDAMQGKSPSLTRRETYFAVIESCASHPRALFMPEAVNRLVYRGGRFFQSNKELLVEALRPLDEVVCWIIDSLSFETPRQDLDNPLGNSLSIRKYKAVLDGMVSAGFVRDNNGYSLVSKAIWTQRLRLLERSHGKWNARLRSYQFEMTNPRAEVLPALAEASPENAQYGLKATPTPREIEDEVVAETEAPASQRLEKIDCVFSHLARLHAQKGGTVFASVESLTHQLGKLSQLKLDEVSRLISGTYSFLRSPFIVLETGNKNQLTIIPDLLDNPHLVDLPDTQRLIEESNVLKRLTRPPQAPALRSSNESSASARTLQRFKRISIEQADHAYRSMCKWIFEHVESPMQPLTKSALLWTLGRSGVSHDLIRRLITETWGTQYRLFELDHHNKHGITLSLTHTNLASFPNTLSYLKTVVWASGRRHDSLLSAETIRDDAVKRYEKAALKDLRKSSTKKDRAYEALITLIYRKISDHIRFARPEALIATLAGAGLQRFQVAFLLGIDNRPPDQLLKLKKDGMGYYVKLDQSALTAYPRCKSYIEMVAVNHYQHPWLFDAPSNPIAASLSMPSKPREITPQVIDDLDLQLDTLYCEMAKIFIAHGNPVIHASESEPLLHDSALEAYLKVCAFRKEFTHERQPVLSLRIMEAPKRLELVIYGSFREQIQRFPKLQRLLSKSVLLLREV